MPKLSESLSGRALPAALAHADSQLEAWRKQFEQSISERIREQEATTTVQAPTTQTVTTPAPTVDLSGIDSEIADLRSQLTTIQELLAMPPSNILGTNNVILPGSNFKIPAGFSLIVSGQLVIGGVLTVDGILKCLPADSDQDIDAVRRYEKTIVLCEAFTPAGTGADKGQVPVPYVNGTQSVTYQVGRINLRVETAGGAPAITIEKSTGAGAFSPTSVGSLTLGSGSSFGTVTDGLGKVTSGDLLRFNVTDAGTANNWTISVELWALA